VLKFVAKHTFLFILMTVGISVLMALSISLITHYYPESTQHNTDITWYTATVIRLLMFYFFIEIFISKIINHQLSRLTEQKANEKGILEIDDDINQTTTTKIKTILIDNKITGLELFLSNKKTFWLPLIIFELLFQTVYFLG